jgi:thiol-disulfide isomerase/thioredoxin
MKRQPVKVLLSITFVLLFVQLLFAQTPNNNSSVKIEIKNSGYVVSGVVSSEAVKNEIAGKVNEISRNNAEFSGLKVNASVEPFAEDWRKGFDKALFKSGLWKSGVFIFTAARNADEYPNVPDEILNAEIFPTGGGAPFRIADYGNKTIVLFFLAAWCKPCREQAETLNAFYSEIPSSSVEIIGIDADADDKENFIRFVKLVNFKYRMGTANENLFDAAIRISKFAGIPQAFLIRDGKLYGIFMGNSPNTVKKLREATLEIAKMR